MQNKLLPDVAEGLLAAVESNVEAARRCVAGTTAAASTGDIQVAHWPHAAEVGGVQRRVEGLVKLNEAVCGRRDRRLHRGIVDMLQHAARGIVGAIIDERGVEDGAVVAVVP